MYVRQFRKHHSVSGALPVPWGLGSFFVGWFAGSSVCGIWSEGSLFQCSLCPGQLDAVMERKVLRSHTETQWKQNTGMVPSHRNRSPPQNRKVYFFFFKAVFKLFLFLSNGCQNGLWSRFPLPVSEPSCGKESRVVGRIGKRPHHRLRGEWVISEHRWCSLTPGSGLESRHERCLDFHWACHVQSRRDDGECPPFPISLTVSIWI